MVWFWVLNSLLLWDVAVGLLLVLRFVWAAFYLRVCSSGLKRREKADDMFGLKRKLMTADT